MKYLVTGACGFLGSNLSAHILDSKAELVGMDNFYRVGAEENEKWLRERGNFNLYRADVSKWTDVEYVIQKEVPDIIFHVAGQVAMTTSLERPSLDFYTNAVGSHNVLEAARRYCPTATLIYSSTNKVYGDLENYKYQENETRYYLESFPEGFDETLGLDFSTPYGCSKGSADQMFLDYARCFNMNTVVFRHSSIYGGRQFSTIDQGWLGWFVAQAIRTKIDPRHQFTICGNGKQVRDVLYSEDLIRCYMSAANCIEKIRGRAFNIGGGIENSLSLLELFKILESKLDVSLNIEKLNPRKSDQKFFVADIRSAREGFDWQPKFDQNEGIERMISWTNQLSHKLT